MSPRRRPCTVLAFTLLFLSGTFTVKAVDAKTGRASSKQISLERSGRIDLTDSDWRTIQKITNDLIGSDVEWSGLNTTPPDQDGPVTESWKRLKDKVIEVGRFTQNTHTHTPQTLLHLQTARPRLLVYTVRSRAP